MAKKNSKQTFVTPTLLRSKSRKRERAVNTMMDAVHEIDHAWVCIDGEMTALYSKEFHGSVELLNAKRKRQIIKLRKQALDGLAAIDEIARLLEDAADEVQAAD